MLVLDFLSSPVFRLLKQGIYYVIGLLCYINDISIFLPQKKKNIYIYIYINLKDYLHPILLQQCKIPKWLLRKIIMKNITTKSN